MEQPDKVWPPPPAEELQYKKPQPADAALSKTWALTRLVAAVIGGFMSPAIAFWSGLLSFLVTTIERVVGCERLEVCGQEYFPLYMVIGGLLAVLLGSVVGGLAASCIQGAVKTGK